MTELKRTCIHHPDRRAIGRCVVTGQPICAECSTRIDGVNYSRQGLEILRRQRHDDPRGGRRGWLALVVMAGAGAPVLIGLAVLFFRFAFDLLIELGRIAE